MTPLAPGDVEGRIRSVTDHEHPPGSHARTLGHEPVQEIAAAEGGAVVVRLAGELDLHNAHLVRDALQRTLREPPPRLVVDLAEVTFLDSTVLGALVEARSQLPDPRRFLLASPRLEARRALEVSGLDRHFAICGSVAEALARDP